MPLVISDELLQLAKMTADEARVKIACRLFAAEKFALWPAARWAGLSRGEMEDELMSRKIPVYRITLEMLAQDLETNRILREKEHDETSNE